MIVLDCCAAIDIANESEKGLALSSLILPEEKTIAPTWFRAEIRNAYWKYVHTGVLSEGEAAGRIELSEALVTDFVPAEECLEEAFAEASRHDHPVYDMLYLCLTRRNAATLFTTDKKLMKICAEAKVNCIEEVDFF